MYKQIYKGQEITISKVIYDNNSVWWYFQINGSNAEDHYLFKRTSLRSAKEIIDNPKREELFGHSIIFN